MIAQTPPMGWNSWDCYGPSVNEKTVRETARIMSEVLRPYGWEYVVVDIQWAQPKAGAFTYDLFSDMTMDAYGRLTPALNRFPSAADGQGFRPLADYVHSLGLKFGIHIMRGMPRMAAHLDLPIEGSPYHAREAANPYSICAWNPDMYGLRCDQDAAQAYYDSIFRLYASWGVDFVKCDDIAREYPHCRREIECISTARDRCGRDIVLSLSPGPAPIEEAAHLMRYANMWRITDDFWDQWEPLRNMFERAERWCVHAGPGHWPDADMLPVGALRQNEDPDGWTNFTADEQKTMMTLWCMMRSPLMIGGDLQKLDDFTRELLCNRELLEIEKATCGAHPLMRTEDACTWIAPAADGKSWYVALFNLSDTVKALTFDPLSAQLPARLAYRELWSGDCGEMDPHFARSVPAHGTAVFHLLPAT